MKIGSMPPVGSPCCTNSHATSSPRPPPITAISTDSPSTSIRIDAFEKPSVLSTPTSLVRSRTDCAIVLAATSIIVKSTATRIAIMMAPMSPTCLAKPSTKPFSVVVLVSAEELANMLSNFAPICCACEASAILTMYQPTSAVAPRPVLVEVVVAEEELRLVDAGLAVVDADDVELPHLALLRLPDGALNRERGRRSSS